ncbi:S49 family peptidase, partial [Neisseria sp. P0014.S004]
YQEQRRARYCAKCGRGVAVLIFLSLIFGLAEEEGKTTSIHARGEHTAVIDLTGEIGNDIDDQVQILRDSMEAAYN